MINFYYLIAAPLLSSLFFEVVCQIGSHTERVVCCQDDNVISHPVRESDCDVNNFFKYRKKFLHSIIRCFPALAFLKFFASNVLKYEMNGINFF